MNNTLKIVLAAVIVGILAFFGWSYMSDAPTSGSSLQSASATKASVAGKELIIIVDRVRAIELRDDVLRSPAFISLKDYSTPLTPVPVGRDNPFLPF